MIISVLRISELRGDVYSGNNLQSFGNIALFLFKMGKEEAGDAVMRQAIELFAKSPIEHGREAAMETFMLYAIQCNHPAKAEKEADELLRTLPTEPLPLTIKMLTAMQRGKASEAKALARQIQSRGGEQSMPYKLAAQILAIDPNR
jgi:Tfp pilus assembly protein PilF